MAETDPTLGARILAAHDWAGGKAEPYLTWLPVWAEPYAVDVVAGLVLFAALVALWRKGIDLLGAMVSWPRGLWRLATGYEPPKSETAIAAQAAERAEEAALRAEQRTEDVLRAVLAGQAGKAEESGSVLPQDAIERAVAAAREVLRSNDPSKAEAQEALRDGNVQAAEDALEEAFNREAQAYARMDDETQQLKTKAARTAREKAALAATRSVADAIRWYQNAADLEPEDFWTQIELARLQQLSGNLTAAFGAAKAAREAASDDRDRMVAFAEIGDVQVAQGDLAGALTSYGASQTIFERLARQDPGNAGWRRDLSVSHEKIGGVQVAQGDLAGALTSYGVSLDFREQLARQDPGNAGWQRDLSVSHERIGDVRVAQGDLAGALTSYGASLEIRERLAQQDPGNAGWRRDLSVSHEKIGGVQVAQGDLAGALTSHGAALEIAEQLARQDPGNAGWQRDLSVSHTKIGDVQEMHGNLTEAIVAYEKSESIAQPLADRFPDHPQFQSDIGITRQRLDELRQAAGHHPKAP